MPIMVERKKWIWYRHTSNVDLIKAVALDVKTQCKTAVTSEEKQHMQERLAALNLYKARNKNKPLDAINHRINTLEFWMFGYEDKKKFIFSPLGNLFLKYITDEEKCSKIFATMLFGMQFQHPGSKTDIEFQLYPFRLLFRLLLDERLNGILYNFEVEYLVVFEKEATEESYENLVSRILQLRKKTKEQVGSLLKQDEHTYVNTVYEWETYTQKFLKNMGIIDCCKGEEICRLYHPPKKNNKSGRTSRKATMGFVSLNEEIKAFVKKLSSKYYFDDKPLLLNDEENLRIDVIKEVYSFYPEELLEEIGEKDSDLQIRLLQLPKLIEKYAANPENRTAYLFEDVLTEGFNMFVNVEAQKIGGAGHTDIECLYLRELPLKDKKFAVDAKSTHNKLLNLNAGRLRVHREEIGASYTIVVTPRYVPAVLQDIRDSAIVIIRASTFAEYLYNHINVGIREIDYKDIDDIITANLGKDISNDISNLTMEKFAAQ